MCVCCGGGGGGACITTVGARVRAAFVRTCVRRVCVCVYLVQHPVARGVGLRESLEQNSQPKGNNLCSHLTMPRNVFAVVPLTLYVSLCSHLS